MPVNPKIYGHLVLFENRFVESGRVELPSKQATKKLSTRLFPVQFFDVGLGQKQPPNAQLLNFEIHPKLVKIQVYLYDSSLSTAINQSFRDESCFPTWQDEANLTIIQIMQQERSFLRRVNVLRHGFTRFVSVLDVLTFQFDLLSKPVDPNLN